MKKLEKYIQQLNKNKNLEITIEFIDEKIVITFFSKITKKGYTKYFDKKKNEFENARKWINNLL